MNVHIREATLPDELAAVRAVYNANRAEPAALERFDWAYLKNPFGQARAWLAIDEGSGRVVGCGGVHPRRVTIDGTPVDGWTTGDLSVDREFRRGGIARRLRLAAKAEVDRGASAFLYTHPNESAESVHARVGTLPLGRMVRWFRPLGLPWGPVWLRRASSLPFRILDRGPRPVEVQHVDRGPLGLDFDDLHQRLAPALGIAVQRTAAYLTWRFLECPIERTALLALRRGRRVCGFIAYADKERYVAVKDWLAEAPEDFDMLVASLSRHARRRGAAWLSLMALEGHPHLARLGRLGFFPRSASTAAMAYAPEGSPWRQDILDRRRWFMTAGDRDV